MKAKEIEKALLWLTTSILFSLLLLAGHLQNGKILLVVTMVLTVVISMISRSFIIPNILSDRFFVWMLSFSSFCALSILWSHNKLLAENQTLDLFEMLVFCVIILISYNSKDDVASLLKVVMVGGYVVFVYVLIYYGFSELVYLMKENHRISNDAINANAIGVYLAYSIVIAYYNFLYEGFKWWEILAIPSFFMLAISGSRKALLFVFAGLLLLTILKHWNFTSKNSILTTLIKWFLTILIFIMLIYTLSKVPAFSKIFERFESLFVSIIDNRDTNDSTSLRMNYIQLGLSLFKKNMLWGVGIDNPRIYNNQIYLHNNYVELLAGIGLLGTILYYSIYGFLLIKYFKSRKQRDGLWNVCVTFLLLALVLDYGMVSYETKSTYFILIILYLNLKNRKDTKLQQ